MVMNEVREVGEVKEAKKPARRGGPVKRDADLLVLSPVLPVVLQVSEFTRRLPREERFELGRQSQEFGAANAIRIRKVGLYASQSLEGVEEAVD
jgi:hypothetical protein